VQIFPLSWYGSLLSLSGWMISGTLAIGGLATGLWLDRYRQETYRRALGLSSGLAIGGVLVGQGLTAWILQVDPARDTGTIPLPTPFDLLAQLIVLGLMLAFPLFVGFMGASVGRFVSEKPSASTLFGMSVAVYGFWVVPWSIYVILD